MFWDQNGLGQTFGENSSNFVIPTTTNGCEYFFLETNEEYPAPENGYCSIENKIDRFTGSERTTVDIGDHSLHCSDDSRFESFYGSNCYELYFTEYGAIGMLSIPSFGLMDKNFNFTDVDGQFKPEILQSRFPLTGNYSYTVKQSDIDSHADSVR